MASGLGARLQAARLSRKVTQIDAAKAIGISQPMLAQVESGARAPSQGMIAKIEKWMSSASRSHLVSEVRGPYKAKVFRSTLGKS